MTQFTNWVKVQKQFPLSTGYPQLTQLQNKSAYFREKAPNTEEMQLLPLSNRVPHSNRKQTGLFQRKSLQRKENKVPGCAQEWHLIAVPLTLGQPLFGGIWNSRSPDKTRSWGLAVGSAATTIATSLLPACAKMCLLSPRSCYSPNDRPIHWEMTCWGKK